MSIRPRGRIAWGRCPADGQLWMLYIRQIRGRTARTQGLFGDWDRNTLELRFAEALRVVEALEAERDELRAACRAAHESIEIAEEVFPAGSVARGALYGAFLGVKAKLRAAIEADGA